jgi:hypothetical protein
MQRSFSLPDTGHRISFVLTRPWRHGDAHCFQWLVAFAAELEMGANGNRYRNTGMHLDGFFRRIIFAPEAALTRREEPNLFNRAMGDGF